MQKEPRRMKKAAIVTALLMASLLQLDAFAEQYLQGHTSYTRMQEVAAGQYQQALDKMSHTYNMLSEMLDKVGMSKLDAAQETWQKFSEADCKFTTDYSRAEPLEKLIYQDCLTSMTEDRTATLEYELRRNFTLDPSLALEKRKK
jgi:uncharacterized protein YecT (DUF1311 family)